jgi:ABC-type phosphate transport system permease subunit
MKIFSSIASICMAIFVFAFYVSGSHGHIRFRPAMAEDWIFGGIVIVCFSMPVIFFISWLKEKDRK